MNFVKLYQILLLATFYDLTWASIENADLRNVDDKETTFNKNNSNAEETTIDIDIDQKTNVTQPIKTERRFRDNDESALSYYYRNIKEILSDYLTQDSEEVTSNLFNYFTEQLKTGEPFRRSAFEAYHYLKPAVETLDTTISEAATTIDQNIRRRTYKDTLKQICVKLQKDEDLNSFYQIVEGFGNKIVSMKNKTLEDLYNKKYKKIIDDWSVLINEELAAQNEKRKSTLQTRRNIINEKCDEIIEYLHNAYDKLFPGNTDRESPDAAFPELISRRNIHIKTDNVKLFRKSILDLTSETFKNIEKLYIENGWAKNVKFIAMMYRQQYKNFLRLSSLQVNKKYTDKFILNSIQVNNHIVRQLIAVLKHRLDQEKVATRTRIPHLLLETDKAHDLLLKRACLNFRACKRGSGFLTMIEEVLTNIAVLKDKEFLRAFRLILKEIGAVDMSHALGSENNMNLKLVLQIVNRFDIMKQRALMLLIKDIIANRYKSLVYTEKEKANYKTSLTFLSIVEMLDEKVADKQRNVKIWFDLRTNTNNWHEDGLKNLDRIISRFVLHVIDVFNHLDAQGKAILKNKLKIILGM